MIHGLALCPGVGGLELGLELAFGPAYRCVAYVEREAYVAGVLAARMQDGDLAPAPIWDDVGTFDGRPWRGRVDLISAGFPCQPHSQAGQRRGTTDARWLWHDVRRVVAEVDPGVVFFENVRGLLSSSRGESFGEVLADLARLGYVGAWGCVRASDVGAPHRRDRVFVLGVLPDAHGLLSQHQRRWSGGASGAGPSGPVGDGARGCMADADRERQRQQGGVGEVREGRANRSEWGGSWGDIGEWAHWEAEPGVGRVADGVADRVDRLRATGNGCVPQQAAVAIVGLAGLAVALAGEAA